MPHPDLLPRIPFKMSCRSAAAVASDLILVALDGGQYSLFYNPFPFSLNFDQGLGSFCD